MFGQLTTLTLSYSYGDDTVRRSDDPNFFRDNTRQQYGVGLTQILTRNLITALNVEVITDEGFLNNPYRSVRFLDPGSPVGFSFEPELYPRTRTTNAVGIRAKYYLPYRAAIETQYRYFIDTWDIQSHTLNYKHRFNFGNTQYLEPRIRLYTQSKAEYYQNSFFSPNDGTAPNLPEFLSADYRLDEMSSATGGFTYGIPFKHDAELRTRLEYMYQSFENSEFDTNKAIIFQISYGKRF